MKAEVYYVGNGGMGDKLYEAQIRIEKVRFVSGRTKTTSYLNKKSCQKIADKFNSALASHVQSELFEKENEIIELRKALEKIANPMGYLKDEADKQGAKLNGLMTLAVINDASFYHKIAIDALKSQKPIQFTLSGKIEQLKKEFTDKKIRELNPIWVRDEILKRLE